MDTLPFANKIALVTGSGRGIGRAIALHFARNGADVVVNFFRNRAPAEETAAEIEKLGRRALLIKADVGELEGIQSVRRDRSRVRRIGYLRSQRRLGLQPTGHAAKA